MTNPTRMLEYCSLVAAEELQKLRIRRKSRQRMDLQTRADQAEAVRDEQSAQVEEASNTINQWQHAYEQLNQQLKEAQASLCSLPSVPAPSEDEQGCKSTYRCGQK